MCSKSLGVAWEKYSKSLWVDWQKHAVPHCISLWVAWEKYTEYTANPCGWHGRRIQNAKQIPVGGMGEICKIHNESLCVVWEKCTEYAANPCGWRGRNTKYTK